MPRPTAARSLSLGAMALLASSCGLLGEGDPDCSALPGDLVAPAASFADDFAGDGDLIDYVTNKASVLPDVGRTDGRYRAVLDDNTDDKTLHFFSSQGRLDARAVSFPFDYVVRNIGIGTVDDAQTAPAPIGDETYIFAGVQVHDLRLDEINSSHLAVGHRGGATYTIEGKNTCDGVSAVDDAGAGVLPDGRADIRIVGTSERTLTVSYQAPNPDPATIDDDWTLYRGTGRLPGEAPEYGETVYIGIITSAQGELGLPYVGTVDAIEDYSER